jgi:hypothetical protein
LGNSSDAVNCGGQPQKKLCFQSLHGLMQITLGEVDRVCQAEKVRKSEFFG